jgi:hypothetical protein
MRNGGENRIFEAVRGFWVDLLRVWWLRFARKTARTRKCID